MKKLTILITLLSTLLLFTGCSEKSKEKPILYKYDIEDYDYSKESFNGYSIEYTADVSGFKTEISSRIELKTGNTCNYYGTYKNETGSTSVLVDYNCNYQIVDNKVSVSIASVKQIYEPSYMAKQQGYKSNTSYETNVVMDGELDKTGKTLKVGELNYNHISYLSYIDKGMQYILVDQKTNKKYKVDGTPAGNSDPEYVRENSLNLEEYQIVDNVKNN